MLLWCRYMYMYINWLLALAILPTLAMNSSGCALFGILLLIEFTKINCLSHNYVCTCTYMYITIRIHEKTSSPSREYCTNVYTWYVHVLYMLDIIISKPLRLLCMGGMVLSHACVSCVSSFFLFLFLILSSVHCGVRYKWLFIIYIHIQWGEG